MISALGLVLPYLFSLFPLLSIYLENIQNMSFYPDTVTTVLALFALTSFFLLTSYILIKDKKKAAVITTLILFMTFSYGHFTLYFIKTFNLVQLIYFDTKYVLVWILLFSYFVYLVIKTKKNLDNLISILAVVVISLVIAPLALIIKFHLEYDFKTNKSLFNKKPEIFNSQHERNLKNIVLPDIYFIVLDRYASRDVLINTYDFDNNEFLNYLSSKGFFVAENSTSNYHKTAHSLASTLNLNYLDSIDSSDTRSDSKFISYIPLYKSLENNLVIAYLSGKGYKYIHFGSWWGPTRKNSNATININYSPMSEFSRVLLDSSIFNPIGIRFGFLDKYSEQRKRIKYQFEELQKIPNSKEPTFVFAHMLIPHPPYVFDKKGESLSLEEMYKRGAKAGYINQLIYTNTKIKELVDLLTSDPNNQPIIIIQADEGPYPPRFQQNTKNFNWNSATKDELEEKFGILNAYYLPGVEKNSLYSNITPVNTFRLVFNQYFGTDLKLFEDRNYVFANEYRPYSFIDITDKLQKKPDTSSTAKVF